jgi:NADPH-dependent glutamate synthase beta subunit-like oxidoreductase
VGAHEGKGLPIPGADLEGVLMGLDFLKAINTNEPIQMGKKVLVLGGGNVAFDCARSALRLGAHEVHIACLESREVMPAALEEIEQGEEEGIVVHPSLTFTRVISEKGRIQGVECLVVDSFEFDEEGNPEIETVEGSRQILPADTVIFAIGQRPEIPEAFELDTDERDYIDVDPYTFDTSVEGVFAAGDAVNGKGSIIEAIASGKKGATAVDKYLDGNGEIDETLAPLEETECWLGPGEGFAALTRTKEVCIAVDDRIKNFHEITRGLGEEAVKEESKRCLQCDLRLKITPVKFWAEYE